MQQHSSHLRRGYTCANGASRYALARGALGAL